MKADIRWIGLTLLLLLSGSSIGCQGLNHTQNGALVGSGLGSVLGAVIGHQSGHTGGGAVIGALAGGLGGSLIGNSKDVQEQRDAALARAYAAEDQRRADARALTNTDLIKMTQNGVSDEVIISSVKTRGGRFDLSPDAIIALKSYGVSDKVVLAIQKTGESSDTVVQTGGTRVVEVPSTHVYVVRPAPPPPRVGIRFSYGPRRRRWRHRHHHHHFHW